MTASVCPKDNTATLSQLPATRDALSFKRGDILGGRYIIDKQIGRGGFGAVYSGAHVGTGQQVAVKVLNLDAKDDNDDVVRRFFQEAKVTAMLKAPNTVRLFDVGQDDAGPLFLGMELLNGKTLHQELRELVVQGKAMTEAQALEVAIAVLRSLHEAHGHGLVHRDLKPANIMLATLDEDEPVVKVLDFGIARSRDSSLTGANKALGTPAYMSPEQCAGSRLDGRSDLYSLGVVLWQLVTGYTPFQDESPLTLMFMHTNDPLPDLRQLARSPLSDGFVSCLLRMLEKSPDRRPPDAKALRSELERVRNGTWTPPVVEPPPPPTDIPDLRRPEDHTTQRVALNDTGRRGKKPEAGTPPPLPGDPAPVVPGTGNLPHTLVLHDDAIQFVEDQGDTEPPPLPKPPPPPLAVDPQPPQNATASLAVARRWPRWLWPAVVGVAGLGVGVGLWLARPGGQKTAATLPAPAKAVEARPEPGRESRPPPVAETMNPPQTPPTDAGSDVEPAVDAQPETHATVAPDVVQVPTDVVPAAPDVPIVSPAPSTKPSGGGKVRVGGKRQGPSVPKASPNANSEPSPLSPGGGTPLKKTVVTD